MATVSGPEIRARLARIPLRIDSLNESDVYRITELARAVEAWREATVPKHASPSRPWKSIALEGKAKDDLRNLGGGDTLRNVVFSWTAVCSLWVPVDERKVSIGLCDWPDVLVVTWAVPRFSIGILVKCRLGGEVYALSAIMGHMSLLRNFHPPLGGLDPKVVVLDDCESLGTHSGARKMTVEMFPARHFLGTQQDLEEGDLGNAYWLPGAEDPSGGLTKVRNEMVPLLWLLESGEFNPASLRHLKGLDRREGNGRVVICN